ncbi:MAG: ribulose-phosphate 3-epimerase [Chlorobiota bacterium]|nr:ribulose-phosphate 3-epimerase [Chlorobiota bacterium]QQS67692.1 MAG: ribulose-phosphate 3-epimerase [Chlorobiota bacterium]
MPETRRLYLSPSILSADFTKLGESCDMLKLGGADYLHVDVMDGHFVPNITIGIPVIKSLKKYSSLPLDCHLMISNPDTSVNDYINAGADILTIHVESSIHLYRTINYIKMSGCKAGVTLNPATSLNTIEEIIPYVDVVLLMSVEPGFGGQAFIPNVIKRIKKVREMIDYSGNFNCLIEIDGGVKLDNIKTVYEAGADIIVSGSGIFDTINPIDTMKNMRDICSMF